MAMNRKSSNLVVAQSMRLDVLAGLQYILESEEVAYNEGMDLLVRKEQAGKEKKLPSSMSLYRLLAEGVAQIRGWFS